MSFQVGDRVRRLVPISYDGMNVGEVYTVEKLDLRGDIKVEEITNGYSTVLGVNVPGPYWKARSFELVSAANKEKEDKVSQVLENVHYRQLRPGDVILAESPAFGTFTVKREVPMFLLPTRYNAVVMVSPGSVTAKYVWLRTGEDLWWKSGSSNRQTDKQVLREAEKHGNLSVLYEGDS